jgi:glucokinase
MENSFVIGVDIGGTNTVYGFIDHLGKIIEYNQISTNASLPADDLINRLEVNFKKFIKLNPNYVLKGIGIGAPNGNHLTGIIVNPPNLNWGDIDIQSRLKNIFSCKVILTNDANAAALGEKKYGVAKNMNDFIMITLGTGLGSGIYSGGNLIYGSDGLAGEMGHITIEINGRKCNCGKYGCLESYVSATGISKTINQLIKKNPEDKLLNSIKNGQLDGIKLDKAFDDNNKIAKRIYSYTGAMLGKGLALVATLFSPEAFIFYGGFSNAGDRIFQFAYSEMEKNLLLNQKGKISLIKSILPEGQAGILGASSLIKI